LPRPSRTSGSAAILSRVAAGDISASNIFDALNG